MSHTQKKTVRQDVTMLKGYKVLSNSKAKMLPYIVAYVCVCVCVCVLATQSCPILLQPHGL